MTKKELDEKEEEEEEINMHFEIKQKKHSNYKLVDFIKEKKRKKEKQDGN